MVATGLIPPATGPCGRSARRRAVQPSPVGGQEHRPVSPGAHGGRQAEIEHRGVRLGVFHPGVGAPLARAMLEQVIARGVREVIACGGAGCDGVLTDPFGRPGRQGRPGRPAKSVPPA